MLSYSFTPDTRVEQHVGIAIDIYLATFKHEFQNSKVIKTAPAGTTHALTHRPMKREKVNIMSNTSTTLDVLQYARYEVATG